ncbi:EAL domain-containing protein [Deinococcus psychrotolerans]|uniref:EAL domain-containing protein n=1 Tax=Deinococcus psychrotolerans TaxID=2489213 RepID=UPI003B9696E1
MTNLPVQVVKIDRSFTAPIGEDTPAGKRALKGVRGIVPLVSALGLPTVAEGIETSEQADLLLKVGCTYFQRYLFGRPEPLP